MPEQQSSACRWSMPMPWWALSYCTTRLPKTALARVLQTLAELIIHQTMVVEQLSFQRWVHNKFIDDLLHERPRSSPAVMLHEAALLGIDLLQPRVVALINIEMTEL